MMVICKDNLDKIKDQERMGADAALAVEGDIARLLNGKTYDELVSLQRRVQEKLGSGEPIDTDYWESLLKKLLVWKAKVGHPVCFHYSLNVAHQRNETGETPRCARSCCQE